MGKIKDKWWEHFQADGQGFRDIYSKTFHTSSTNIFKLKLWWLAFQCPEFQQKAPLIRAGLLCLFDDNILSGSATKNKDEVARRAKEAQRRSRAAALGGGGAGGEGVCGSAKRSSAR